MSHHSYRTEWSRVSLIYMVVASTTIGSVHAASASSLVITVSWGTKIIFRASKYVP